MKYILHLVHYNIIFFICYINILCYLSCIFFIFLREIVFIVLPLYLWESLLLILSLFLQPFPPSQYPPAISLLEKLFPHLEHTLLLDVCSKAQKPHKIVFANSFLWLVTVSLWHSSHGNTLLQQLNLNHLKDCLKCLHVP